MRLSLPVGVDTRLGRRLIGLSVFRLVVLAVFMLVIELYYLQALVFGGFSSVVAIATVGIAFTMTALYLVVLRRGRQLAIAAHAQLITDQLVWTSIVYISGGVMSGSSALYGLTCLSGAILLGTNGAISAAVAGIVCYLGMCLCLVQGWLPPPSDQPSFVYSFSSAEMTYAAFSTVMAISVVTVLSAFLSERLRAVGGRLEAVTKRAEHAERLAGLGRLAAGLAHEIRNPLGSIRGSIELLRRGGELDHEDQRLCEIVEHETVRLDDLVTNMVDLSKPRIPEKGNTDLADTVQNVVKLAASAGRGHEVDVRYVGPGSVTVVADQAQMKQVLWNLVRNAMQVCSAGSEVVVRLTREEDGAVVMTVVDDGPGIPESRRDHIFDAFFTTRSGGAGVGLAVVKQIVDAHDFGLMVESESGMGAAFSVRIPAAAVVAAVTLLIAGCSGSDWVNPVAPVTELGQDAYFWADGEPSAQPPTVGAPIPQSPAASTASGSPVKISLQGTPTSVGKFRNTYYDFPHEPTHAETGPTRQLFDAQCKPIRTVSQTFHDSVCVQGSGKLATGETVSFAKRNCSCAAVCPRTSQRICFDKLDKKKFPYGRGATGRAITPLRTVAVDTKVVPLGTVLYIPDYHGLRDLEGKPHDGCFIAEDRGLKVKGLHVDIFTGKPAATVAWNAAVPSNRGVRVVQGASRCTYLRKLRKRKDAR